MRQWIVLSINSLFSICLITAMLAMILLVGCGVIAVIKATLSMGVCT